MERVEASEATHVSPLTCSSQMSSVHYKMQHGNVQQCVHFVIRPSGLKSQLCTGKHSMARTQV